MLPQVRQGLVVVALRPCPAVVVLNLRGLLVSLRAGQVVVVPL